MLLQSLYLLCENADYIKAASRSRCGVDNQATRYICCKPLELLFLQLNHSLDENFFLSCLKVSETTTTCVSVFWFTTK